jgi:hypothetical protein
LPSELTLEAPNGGNLLNCAGITGITLLTCKIDDVNKLHVTLTEITQENGLFKLSVENIRNGASLRRSSPFAEWFHTTSFGANVAKFSGVTTVINDYSSDLQGLGESSIVMGDYMYEAETDYKITFTPYSHSKLWPASLQFSYPSSVSPAADALDAAGGCTLTFEDGVAPTTRAQCKKIPNARLFRVESGIPANYKGKVTINIKMINPVDNWGEIGIKIKTYEVFSDGIEYMVDQIEGN